MLRDVHGKGRGEIGGGGAAFINEARHARKKNKNKQDADVESKWME